MGSREGKGFFLKFPSNFQVLTPHCSGITINGHSPGPIITAQKGDSVNLNVQNHITDPLMRRSTSIHWHGIFQNRTSSNDGPAFVTQVTFSKNPLIRCIILILYIQCPIAPNSSFLYTFPLREQAGTFWWHSHLSTQYCDGLRGSLIIYDPDDPLKDMYDVDDESTVVTISDYYHQQAPLLEKGDFQTAVVP